MVPSARPARSASRSRVARSGGTRWHWESNQPMSTSHRWRWWTPTSQVTGRPSFFASRTMRDALRRREPAQMNAPRPSRASGRRSSPARSSRRQTGIAGRPSRVATSPSCATPPRPRQGSCGRSHTRWPKVAAYCMRAQQHLRVGQRRFGLRKRDAARFGEFAHLGEFGAREPDRQRADRVDVRKVEARARGASTFRRAPARPAADRCRADRRGW